MRPAALSGLGFFPGQPRTTLGRRTARWTVCHTLIGDEPFDLFRLGHVLPPTCFTLPVELPENHIFLGMPTAPAFGMLSGRIIPGGPLLIRGPAGCAPILGGAPPRDGR
jgi:hypothetical protein